MASRWVATGREPNVRLQYVVNGRILTSLDCPKGKADAQREAAVRNERKADGLAVAKELAARSIRQSAPEYTETRPIVVPEQATTADVVAGLQMLADGKHPTGWSINDLAEQAARRLQGEGAHPTPKPVEGPGAQSWDLARAYAGFALRFLNGPHTEPSNTLGAIGNLAEAAKYAELAGRGI